MLQNPRILDLLQLAQAWCAEGVGFGGYGVDSDCAKRLGLGFGGTVLVQIVKSA